jgi:hypothetical protein
LSVAGGHAYACPPIYRLDRTADQVVLHHLVVIRKFCPPVGLGDSPPPARRRYWRAIGSVEAEDWTDMYKEKRGHQLPALCTPRTRLLSRATSLPHSKCATTNPKRNETKSLFCSLSFHYPSTNCIHGRLLFTSLRATSIFIDLV